MNAALLIIGGLVALYVLHQSAGSAQSSAVPQTNMPMLPDSTTASVSNPFANGTHVWNLQDIYDPNNPYSTVVPTNYTLAQTPSQTAQNIPVMGPQPGTVITVPGSTTVYDTGPWTNPGIVNNDAILSQFPGLVSQSPGALETTPAPAGVTSHDPDYAGFNPPPFPDWTSPLALLYQTQWNMYGRIPQSGPNWATQIMMLSGGTIQGPNAAVLFPPPDDALRYMSINEYWQKLYPYMQQHFGMSGLGGWAT